jgi:acetylornithine deacetylase/succinyl-diaminopimelate desuccinylase-like protein
MNWGAHLKGALDILCDLIRIDTTNPPGNELAAAEYLKKVMGRGGIAAQVLVSEGTRGSVVARLKGSGAEKPLLLLGHIDVVPVDVENWSVDPFAAMVKNGAVYGRGALDMKGMVSVEAATMLALKRERVALNRDVIFVAAADEEMGGGKGAGWLVQNHWDKVGAAYVINEGGGGLIKDGIKLFHCQCAEKGICWAKMRVRGEGGHASAPHSNNPTVILSQAISKIGAYLFPPVSNDVTVLALKRMDKAGMLPDGITAEEALSQDEEIGRRLQAADHRISAIIRNTATPTAIKGGGKTNVIPQQAEVDLDCRAFPEMQPSDLLKTVERIVDDPRVQVEVVRDSRGSSSPLDTDLWRAIESTVARAEPDAVFLPYQSAGGTDSGFFREKGAVCYGADPFFVTEEEWDTIHGNDERIRVETLDWGLRWMYELVGGFCGGAGR